jgi:hypothetical protein
MGDKLRAVVGANVLGGAVGLDGLGEHDHGRDYPISFPLSCKLSSLDRSSKLDATFAAMKQRPKSLYYPTGVVTVCWSS